ncbi:MAG: hypothetical protein K9L59_07850 [Desulfobacterales bacterium]|nr:hypothetical protein [Desulfobacterales bacterium]
MVNIKIDFFVWETISAFKAIHRYFELIEAQIEKVKDEDWEELKQLPVPTDEEEYQTEYAPKIQAHKNEFEKVLPMLVGYSFVMMLFSELEFRINEICRELKKRDHLPLKINDFKGNLIERFSKFLIIANKPPLENIEKAEITDFILIRNCVVHNNGFIKNFSDPKKLRNRVNNKLHIEMAGKGNNERIRVSGRFLYSKIEFFIAMFRRLFDALNFGPEYPVIYHRQSRWLEKCEPLKAVV